jgi:hypothetical protein
MGISHRGNFALALQHGPVNERRLLDIEGEWAAQWEPTVPQTHTGVWQTVQYAQTSEGLRTDLEVVISVRPHQTLRIKLVA